MTKRKNFKQLREQLIERDPTAEGRIAEHRDELERALSLAELRHARDMTQVQLAQALDVRQPAVSRIEHQTDLYVSTLRSYVQALGGDLKIVACFGETSIEIGDFEELEDEAAAIA